MPKTRIDDSVFQSKMRRLLKEAKISEKDFIKEQGALYARDMAKATPPFSGGSISLTKKSIGSGADKKAGEGAIWTDLLKIFRPMGVGVIRWAQRTFGQGPIYRGKTQTGAGVITSIQGIRNFHHQNQRSRGRTRSLGKDGNKVWVQESLLKKYHTEAKKSVGRAKAAFAKAMTDLNPKQEVPAWIRRNYTPEDGRGSLRILTKGVKATIVAKAPGVDRMLDKLSYLERFRLLAMEKRLKFIIRANAKKARLKVS